MTHLKENGLKLSILAVPLQKEIIQLGDSDTLCAHITTNRLLYLEVARNTWIP